MKGTDGFAKMRVLNQNPFIERMVNKNERDKFQANNDRIGNIFVLSSLGCNIPTGSTYINRNFCTNDVMFDRYYRRIWVNFELLIKDRSEIEDGMWKKLSWICCNRIILR